METKQGIIICDICGEEIKDNEQVLIIGDTIICEKCDLEWAYENAKEEQDD